MIAKILPNRNVKGCISYVLDKREAELLYTQDVRDYDRKAMLQDFAFYEKLNDRVKNSVLHISVSFHQRDLEQLDGCKMKKIAAELLEGMGWDKLPYLCCRHNDQKHPHFHLVVGRVGRDGKAANDSFSKLKMKRVVQRLEKMYPELTAAISKDLTAINQNQLKGADAIKIKIYTAIMKELYNSRNIDHLFALLKERHTIDTKIVYKGSTDQIQGLRFGVKDFWLKGSQVDKSCSYKHLKQSIEELKPQSLTPNKPVMEEKGTKSTRRNSSIVPLNSKVINDRNIEKDPLGETKHYYRPKF